MGRIEKPAETTLERLITDLHAEVEEDKDEG
jgi:hypothetical protein